MSEVWRPITREAVVDVHGVTFRVPVNYSADETEWEEQAVYVDDSERDIANLLSHDAYDALIREVGRYLREAS